MQGCTVKEPCIRCQPWRSASSIAAHGFAEGQITLLKQLIVARKQKRYRGTGSDLQTEETGDHR